jgi:hypothetical protein
LAEDAIGPASEALGTIGKSIVLDQVNDLPARRGAAAVSARGSGRSGDLRGYRAVRCEEIDLLPWFRPFRDGTPSHDHLGDIFATLDAGAFQRWCVSWVAALTGALADVIAIDGKTLRRSYQKKGTKAPIYMVSAFAHASLAERLFEKPHHVH